ncbi:MAG TPA: hypothetical protein ENH82_08120 [bacterium]|nr:hypothetical protein [bacterium]
MASVLDLITDSAETARIFAPGDTLLNDKAQSIFRELNRMIGSWANENFLIFEQKEETLTLVADQASYTIGKSGSPDFDTVRPQEILKGSFIRKSGGNQDFPLAVKSFEEYRRIGNKSTGARPWWIAYNPTFPNGTLFLWFRPNATDELHLLSLKELGSFTGLTQTISLPPGYEDAIHYNLAIRIAPKYGKQQRADIVAEATKSIKVLKRRNAQRLSPTQLEVGMFTNRRRHNISDGPFFP